MIFDSDDFGCNHIISDVCQSHDCRDVLDKLHYANPLFKATLFTIPGEVTYELLGWCKANESWIQLAWHGFYHRTNYECAEMSYEEFDANMKKFKVFEDYFVKGFKAPGWQISDDIYKWLVDNKFWVADQSYNNDRRPKELPAYVNNNGRFNVHLNGIISDDIPAYHSHTWDTVGNGIYERFEDIKSVISNIGSFKFISEAINETTQTYTEQVGNGG